MTSQRSSLPKKKKKLLKCFSEIGTFKEKLTPTDDGQVGIRKAPLQSGTAELKRAMDTV
jgi:hypothetical protein